MLSYGRARCSYFSLLYSTLSRHAVMRLILLFLICWQISLYTTCIQEVSLFFCVYVYLSATSFAYRSNEGSPSFHLSFWSVPELFLFMLSLSSSSKLQVSRVHSWSAVGAGPSGVNQLIGVMMTGFGQSSLPCSLWCSEASLYSCPSHF